MEAWAWGLLLKPLIGIVLVAGLLLSSKFIARLIYWVLPDSRLKRELFRTTASDAGGGGDSTDRLLK